MRIILNGGKKEDENLIIVGSFLRAFKSIGHEVEFFPVMGFYNEKLDMFHNRYVRGLVHRVFWRLLCRSLNKRFLARITEFKPNLIFIYKGWHVSPKTLVTIKKKWPKVPLFCFNPENPFSLWNFSYSNPWMLKSIPLYDVYFTWGKFMIDNIRKAGAKRIKYLPLGFDPEYNYPAEPKNEEERKKYGSDIAFIGSWDKEREEWLNHLIDFDLKIWGVGWNNANRKLKSKWQNVGDDFPKICGAAKIVLDILRRQMQPGNSLKTFEVPACKGFLMCNWGGELYDFFEEGKEIVTFTDPEDMIKKIKFYLERDDLRKKISEAAYKRVQSYSYMNRTKQILDVYDDFIKLR